MDDRENTSNDNPGHNDDEPRAHVIEISGKTIWQAIGAVIAAMAALWMIGEASHLLAMVAISFFFSLAPYTIG